MNTKEKARVPAGQVITFPSHHNVAEQFREAIQAAGLTPPAEIRADGEIHRFSSNGKRGNDSGWYVLHADGIPSGAFGCWSQLVSEKWCANIGRALTADEAREQVERAARATHLRNVERERQRADARERACAIWGNAKPANADHPYLQRKAVQPLLLRVHADGRLVVPMKDSAGELHGLQFIADDGAKRFLRGQLTAGLVCTLKGVKSGAICIAEGFATAASICEATGYTTIAAFNCGNLEPVARAIREKRPQTLLILCADDDVRTEGNPGLTKARSAAQAVGGTVAIPDFGTPRPEGVSDFNDLARMAGPDAVRKCVDLACPKEPTPPHPAVPVTNAANWPEPLPLVAETENDVPYPIGALPEAIGAAVKEVAAFVQCPSALAACSALSVISVAIQGQVNVRRGPDLEGPVSLYVVTLAESGERKSETDRRFTDQVRRWEMDQRRKLAPEFARYRADFAAWEAKRDAKIQRIKELSKKNKPVCAEEEELEHLEQNRPIPVREPRRLLENETTESLAFALARPDREPSVGIFSAEGGAVFGSHSMRGEQLPAHLAVLNKLWSGESLSVGRRTSESYTVDCARLSLNISVQPATFARFSEDSRGLARGSGFWARCLLSRPRSTQGTRAFRDGPATWEACDRFNLRLARLLNLPLPLDDNGVLRPRPIDMSTEAFSEWRKFHDGIERELRDGGEMAELRDCASKAAENVARVAAVFHAFEHGTDGELSAQNVAAAAAIVSWHLLEARRVLGSLALAKPLADACRLDEWLARVCRERGSDCIARRDVQRLGPNSLRSKKDLTAAMEELREARRARFESGDKVIRVNPALLRSAP